MRTLYFCPVVSSIFFSSPNLSGRRLDVYHTSTHGVALVQIYNAGMKRVAHSLEMQDPKKSPKSRYLGTITPLCRAITSQRRLVSRIGKTLLSSNISRTCPHSMVNFGPLAAEIGPVGWGTPANFNVFYCSRLGSITARHSSSGRQPNFAALNRGRHLYSAGRPSRWALADICSSLML